MNLLIHVFKCMNKESINMPKLESLKNLGVMIPKSKKAIFKGNCASAGLDMREVLESFVDSFNENPKILDGLKK